MLWPRSGCFGLALGSLWAKAIRSLVLFRPALLRACPVQACLSQGLSCSGLLFSGLLLFRAALLKADPVQGCSPQGWSCSGLLSSGLVLFRPALLRPCPVQACSPQGFSCSGLLSSGLDLFRPALLRAKWEHLGYQIGAFRDQMGAFEAAFQTPNGSKWGQHLGQQMARFRAANDSIQDRI